MLGQIRRRGVNIIQRRIRLTGIEPAMGCDAGPASNWHWVGRPTLLPT